MNDDCFCWQDLDSLEFDHYARCDVLRRQQRGCGDCEPGLPCRDHEGATR